jgi:hypothetical protein
MRLIRSRVQQPDDSSLCGQCCVAMAAGVSLDRAIEVMGEDEAGTTTVEVVTALRALGVPCADKLKRISRAKPVLPKRAIFAIQRPKKERRKEANHWMLSWDGKVYDPGGGWPEWYKDWRITSYLEIFS